MNERMIRPRLDSDPPPSIVVYPDNSICLEGAQLKKRQGFQFLNTLGFPRRRSYDEYHLIEGYGVVLLGDEQREDTNSEDRVTIEHQTITT